MDTLPFVVGRHPTMQRIADLTRKVAETDATVLITGESGTGKELVARAIHALSARADRPFIPVNCAAIPADLLESELFGHERGAFTGAVAARAGMFQLATGGSIFLDEVGEMGGSLQVRLLRVLQDQEVRPVGADRSTRVDVRVIAATNKDLTREIARGVFREDLFYRLQVIPIAIPPLRERRSDVRLLVEHFLEKLNRMRPERPVRVTDAAMTMLWEYDWPGNVRELEHLLERVVILAEDSAVDVEHLPLAIRSFLSERNVPKPVLTPSGLDLRLAVAQFEIALIEQALRRTRGNKQAAARLLGLKRTTLVAKMQRREMPCEAIVYREVGRA
jgi:transcriptional regulator with PAS, ATPase and Fis domain